MNAWMYVHMGGQTGNFQFWWCIKCHEI